MQSTSVVASTSRCTATKRRSRDESATTVDTVDVVAEEKQQKEKKKELPDELWAKILENVDDNSVVAFASVCKQLRRVQQDSR